MTMHRIEIMEATLAELDNAEAAAVFRVMVENVARIHRLSGPELMTCEEFYVAVSKVPTAERKYEAIRAQAWDREHLDAYMAKHALKPSQHPEDWGRLADDRAMVRRHMNGEALF